MQLVSQAILNPSYGLFLYADDDCNTVQLNPDSGINPVKSHIPASSYLNTLPVAQAS